MKDEYGEMYLSMKTISIYLFVIAGLLALIFTIGVPLLCYVYYIQNRTSQNNNVSELLHSITELNVLLDQIAERRPSNFNNFIVADIINYFTPVQIFTEKCQICFDNGDDLKSPPKLMSSQDKREYCDEPNHTTCGDCLEIYLKFCKEKNENPKCPQCRRLWNITTNRV